MPEVLRIGGVQYSWNSSITKIDGQAVRGLTGVDWGQKLDRETVYAQTQDGVPLGPTAGQYAADGFKLTWLWEYWEQLKASYLATIAPGSPIGNRGLPGSYGQTGINLQVAASEPLQIGALPILLAAGPCLLTGETGAAKKGNAALEVETTWWVQKMSINGLTMYTPALPSI